ncbi:low molecular weight phosphatase family protein [Halorubrum sp. Ib24]|uniref:arsenate-mycothiol transferase ArsC n=1 Tax=Halorubrum sp. Ib24 TaxID=1383850 RepID=UPI000B9906A5|nr:low molecular weight phosphatase family protein [Halorubrum sp. Ib24]OYR40023.1 low molecular weight phosphatase family protein [Halorubrum sp. Ib24]
MTSSDRLRLDFVCVHNAGRSQMAAAFAERERDERDLTDVVEIHSGGTEPADAVHDPVVEAMAEVGIDISDRRPKWVADLEQLADSDYVVTMGCSIMHFEPAQYGVESRDWDLVNPDGEDIDTVRAVREEIEEKVSALFDEIEGSAADGRVEADESGGFVASLRESLSR